MPCCECVHALKKQQLIERQELPFFYLFWPFLSLWLSDEPKWTISPVTWRTGSQRTTTKGNGNRTTLKFQCHKPEEETSWGGKGLSPGTLIIANDFLSSLLVSAISQKNGIFVKINLYDIWNKSFESCGLFCSALNPDPTSVQAGESLCLDLFADFLPTEWTLK